MDEEDASCKAQTCSPHPSGIRLPPSPLEKAIGLALCGGVRRVEGTLVAEGGRTMFAPTSLCIARENPRLPCRKPKKPSASYKDCLGNLKGRLLTPVAKDNSLKCVRRIARSRGLCPHLQYHPFDGWIIIVFRKPRDSPPAMQDAWFSRG